MALTLSDVAAIADYARIALARDELEQMRDYLNDAIELLEPVRAYDLEGVEPTYHPIGELANVDADDAVDEKRSLDREVALSLAAAAREGCFRVPSILSAEKDGA